MIDATRRQLIDGMLTGALLTTVPAPLLASLPDRYVQLIDAQRGVLAGGDADYLYYVLRERFGQMPHNHEEARQRTEQLLAGEISLDTFNIADLREYEDYLVTFAVLRRLIRGSSYELRDRMLRSDGFIDFAERFQHLFASKIEYRG